MNQNPTLATISIHTILIGDIAVHYRIIGDILAPRPTLFLHGWQMSGARSFEAFFSLFDHDSQVCIIALDMPGFGLNQDIEVLPFTDLILFCIAFVVALGIMNPLDGIGYSFGGLVLYYILQQIPHLFRRIVFLTVPLLPFERTFSHTFSTKNHQSLYQEAGQQLELHTTPLSVWHPVLMIWGTRDVVVPLHIGRYINAALPNSRMVILDGADHKLYHDPQALYLPIKQFLLS